MATTVTPAAQRHMERLDRIWAERRGLIGWLTTTDHKRIGILYFFTSLAFFGAGGVEALLIRTQLIGPNHHLLSPEAYDQLFTMHGITMIFLFVIPMTTGAFGNYLIPLMIGARDMAFPRMNALSYWIYLASGIFMYVALAQGHAPNAGWFDYVPLASKQFDPGNNIDFYGWGLIFNGISSTAAAINFIVTIFKLRAPGMSINRMPLFCFAFLAVAFALLFALPSLSVAALFLELDRQLGFHFYDVSHGGDPLLVAEPVLDLRTPRGLHHHPAGVRDRHLDHPGVRAPPDGAVSAGRAVGDPGRVPRLRRLAAPHVHGRVLEPDDRLLRRRQPDHRDPVGDPAVRLDHDDPDRHA